MNILCENNYPLITLPGNGNEFFSSSSFFTKKKKKGKDEEEEEDWKEAGTIGAVHVQTYGFTLWDST